MVLAMPAQRFARIAWWQQAAAAIFLGLGVGGMESAAAHIGQTHGRGRAQRW
jgi:hypothetical protein